MTFLLAGATRRTLNYVSMTHCDNEGNKYNELDAVLQVSIIIIPAESCSRSHLRLIFLSSATGKMVQIGQQPAGHDVYDLVYGNDRLTCTDT